MNPTPQRVDPARVYRFYQGGSLIGRLRGHDEPDADHPEDWVASITRASNPGRHEPDAGLARLAGGGLLREAIAGDPQGWLGSDHIQRFGPDTTGLLVKLLDAAQRLPVHAHPDRAFTARHFGDRFGKTEAWIVIGTRSDDAEVRVGLREAVEPRTYRDWIDRQDTDALLDSLHRVPVKAGTVVFVPAGVPHAIGAGVLMVELQEPTDYSALCEWKGFPIGAEDSHLGLGWDTTFEALDLSPQEPVIGLPDDAGAFFWADDVAGPAGRFAVLLVLEGEGRVAGQPARAGDAFAVPASAERLDVEGDLRVLRCLAPDPAA